MTLTVLKAWCCGGTVFRLVARRCEVCGYVWTALVLDGPLPTCPACERVDPAYRPLVREP